MNTDLLQRLGASLAALLAAAVLLTGCSNQNQQAPASGKPTKLITAATPGGTTCEAHGVAKELCFICDPSLRDKERLWCYEHGRYEDRCWICHPELQDKSRLWCAEHSLYEDECFLCHPELLEAKPAPAVDKLDAPAGAGPASAAAVLMCTEHGVPEQECGICHPELLSEKPPGQGLKVRLPSTDSAAKAGVIVGTPAVERVEQGVECFAELTFNQNKLAQITPLVGGIVKSVEVDLGSRVKKGDLLALITSMAIGEAQSAYLKSVADAQLRQTSLERERSLYGERVSSQKELQEAEAAHRTAMAASRQAEQQLMALGFREQQIRALIEQQGTPGVLEVRAPFAGEIVERAAVQGAMVETGKPLFVLADPTALWAMVNIPESQLSRVQIGQKVELTVESLSGPPFVGRLTWLASSVDERTRMALGRVEVANTGGRLKAQMFARARIVTGTSEQAIVVPQSALQDVEGTAVVFVKAAGDLFEARPVQLGTRRNGQVEIVSGLGSAEPVALAGTFALKSQFLISRLGAGCVD